MGRTAISHDVVVAFSELRAMGITWPHVNTLRQQMVNSGFDPMSAREAIGDAVGVGLLIYHRKREQVTLNMDS